MKAKKGGCVIRWMAVVRSGDAEYVIDIENREFRQLYGRDRVVAFDSEQGWPTARPIIGDSWRKPAGRSLWEKEQESMAKYPQCGQRRATP